MDSFIAAIQKYNMLIPGDSVIAGISGGADSVSMLSLLLKLKQKFSLSVRAVHVNHGLRGAEAAADENFVRQLCAKLETELDVIEADVSGTAKSLGISIEEAGRRLRYEAFEEIRIKYRFEKIAVAHNKNDDAETVLMWILRGAGLKGLCGIPPVRGRIIRPLIGTSRNEIEVYCRTNNLEYRTDASNLKTLYRRNKLRLELIPFLCNNYNPNIVDTLVRMSGSLSKDNDFLEKEAEKAYLNCVLEEETFTEGKISDETLVRLDINKLRSCHEAVAARVIRIAASSLGMDLHDLYMTHYESIYKLIDRLTGKKIFLPKGMFAAVEYGVLILGIGYKRPRGTDICREMLPEVPVYIEEFGIKAVLTQNPDFFNSVDFSDNVCTKEFCYDKMDVNVEIRNRRPGDKIYVSSMGGSKKIKDYFNGIKLAARLRDFVPLVACGSDILWIVDGKNITSDRFKAEEGKPKAYIQILRKNPGIMRGAVNNERGKN